MEFKKNVKDQLKNANSKEEVQGILDETKRNAAEAGVILSDEDLEAASGGVGTPIKDSSKGGLISKGDGGSTGGGMGLMH